MLQLDVQNSVLFLKDKNIFSVVIPWCDYAGLATTWSKVGNITASRVAVELLPCMLIDPTLVRRYLTRHENYRFNKGSDHSSG